MPPSTRGVLPGEPLSADLVDSDPPPETVAMASGERGSLLAAVQRLPLPYRQPVVLMLEDFSPPRLPRCWA